MYGLFSPDYVYFVNISKMLLELCSSLFSPAPLQTMKGHRSRRTRCRCRWLVVNAPAVRPQKCRPEKCQL